MVLIEFTLVIVGVLIALQVDNWNADRLDIERGQIYLARFEDDLGKDIEGLTARISYWEKVAGYGEQALAAVDVEQATDSDPRAALLAFMHASQANAYFATDTTHAELKSAGELSLIRDAQLRADLSDYYALSAARSDWLFGVNPAYRGRVRGIMPLSFQTFYWSDCYDVERDLSGGLGQCDVPLGTEEAGALLDSLAARSDLIEALRSWIIDLRISINLARLELQDAEALRQRVISARASP